jgi:hypothetical protein
VTSRNIFLIVAMAPVALFAITSGEQVSLGGTVTSAYSSTANVIELYDIDHTAYWENSSVATETYSNKPDTANANLPTTMEQGGISTSSTTYTGSPNALFKIAGGRLTLTAPGSGAPMAGFVTATPPDNVTRLTTKFVLNVSGSPTTTSGVVAQILGGSGNFGAHLVVASTYVQLQKMISGVWTSLFITNYNVSLPLDNTTIHQVDLYRNGSTATVYLDGSLMGSATDPDIATYSLNWCSWEIDVSNNTDNVPGILFAEVGWGAASGPAAVESSHLLTI